MLKALTLAVRPARRKRRFTLHADRFDALLIKVRSSTRRPAVDDIDWQNYKRPILP